MRFTSQRNDLAWLKKANRRVPYQPKPNREYKELTERKEATEKHLAELGYKPKGRAETRRLLRSVGIRRSERKKGRRVYKGLTDEQT